MKALLAAPAAVLIALLGLLPTAGADPGSGPGDFPVPGPPYVDHIEWTRRVGMARLRVFPTPAARVTSRRSGTAASANEAWSEVLARSPNADTAGMRAQFDCHWQYAERVLPDKTSWNLEPWRPVVDYDEMVVSGCNPGGAEEGPAEGAS